MGTMEIQLPPELVELVEREVSSGRFPSADHLIAQALRDFFEERERENSRREALRRIGDAVDRAGLYDKVLL
jgi:Arc/MetJ-type ribon-helix-helix transcriptional regulator